MLFFTFEQFVIINKDKFNQKLTIYQLLGIKNKTGNVKSKNERLKAAQNFENGFKYGLKNPEIANLLTRYFMQKQQAQKAVFFRNYLN